MRKLKTGERDYTLSDEERENILSRAASIYRKGITVRFVKWIFFLLAFFIGVFPMLSWKVDGVLNIIRLWIGLLSIAIVIVWQLVKLIKIFTIRQKLNTLDDSTLAVVFRDIQRPIATKTERWKVYLLSTLLLLIATAVLDCIAFGALTPLCTGKGFGFIYLLLGLSKLSIIVERAYEEKTQADFYITSCHLF